MVLKVLCAILITFLLMYFIGKGLMEDVVDSLCDKAFEDLHNWRLANPCTCIGDSFYAKSLVLKRIEALERLWKVFNLKRDEQQIAYLYSLLDDHFNPPGTRKNIKRTARKTRAVYLCILVVLNVSNRPASFGPIYGRDLSSLNGPPVKYQSIHMAQNIANAFSKNPIDTLYNKFSISNF